MKKIVCLMLAVIVAMCALTACDTVNLADPFAQPEFQKSKIGNVNIVIDSCRLAEDYYGNPIVIVKYIFTNNGDEATSFDSSLYTEVYQDGVGLNQWYTGYASDAIYSPDNQIRPIKKGVSLDVEVAYELNNTTSDIEVEVYGREIFSNTKVTKTLEIYGKSLTTEEPPKETVVQNQSSNLGDYNVVIDSCRLAEDYYGKPVIIVKYIFTNNGDDATSFASSLDTEVYQDGVGLIDCYAFDIVDSENYSFENQSRSIKKGVSLDVEVAYELNDTTGDIEVEVVEYNSGKKITKIFKIN